MRNAVARALCACAVAALMTACALRKPPPSSELDEAGYREAVSALASDEFEGRRPGTPGEEKTVAHLVDQFRKLGLKPISGDNYLQPVPMTEITAGRDASLTVSGHGSVKSLGYAKDMVVWSGRAVPDASLRDSDLVFVGYGIVAPEYDWNDYGQTDVHGKTVVVLVNDPGYGSKDPRVFRGNAETAYGLWTYKVEEAARQGAAGVLLLHDAGAVGYGWNVVVNERTGPQLEPAGSGDADVGPVLDAWITADAGRALFTQGGLDYAALTTAASRPGFKPVAMGLKVNAAVHNSVRRFTSANVIGLLPGARRKHEYVVFGAHWDGLGRQSAEAGGAIRNGAVDNASGVAGLLMLAQSFVRTQPVADRSMVFVAFTGGEAARLGSSYYVEHAPYPLRDTAGYLNLESLHIGGPSRDVMVFGYGNSELEEYLRDAALLEGKEVHPDPTPERGAYYRSDQYSFARAGVPALFAQAGVDDSARGPAWGQAQIDDYMAHRYHQPQDKYQPDWDVRGTLDDLRFYYEVGNRLARSRHFPRWYPSSEFRTNHHRSPEAPE